MMRISKLITIAVLTGTLGLLGCGDDSSTTPSGGSGGTAGSGGEGGGGGMQMLTACSEGPLAETGETATASLGCVATLPFDISVSFNATPTAPLQAGANTFELQLEVAIDSATVNSVIDLASEVNVTDVRSTINATLGDSDPTPVETVDQGVPCTLTFERDTDAVIVTTVSEGTWDLDDGGTLELTLDSLTQAVEALGLPVVLTTEGTEPTCEFLSDLPSVQFSLIQ